MDKIKIIPARLYSGSVSVSGFKHLFVGILCSTITMPTTRFVIHNIPRILETKILVSIMRHLGAHVIDMQDTLIIETGSLKSHQVPTDLSQKIHGAIYLFPSLLVRTGNIMIGDSGGCQIGGVDNNNQRPIAHMIAILEQFGAQIVKEDTVLHGTLSHVASEQTIDILDYSDSKEIITGPLISGATKTAIIAALGCRQGKTRIKNHYQKPDVLDLVRFLQASGHDITIDNHQIIFNHDNYQPVKSVDFVLTPDVSQIMTFITTALYCDISLTIRNIIKSAVLEGLHHELRILRTMGINIQIKDTSMVIEANQKIVACDIEVTSCSIYSDHQPFFALLLSKADAASCIMERVWRDRFTYAVELNKMGFSFELKQGQLHIKPSCAHRAALCRAGDLRAAAVLLIAALQNTQPCVLEGIHHLERGYDNLIHDLELLGARIENPVLAPVYD